MLNNNTVNYGLALRSLIVAIISALLLLGCSSSETPKELSTIAALKSSANPKISAMRLTALKEAARSLGAQAGLASRSRQINLMLNREKSSLDHIFNFNYLMLNQTVMPPVLAEGRNTLNLADDFSIRVSDHDFQIVQAPRFVTAPPTWRDYIWMNYKKPDDPNTTLLPQSLEERKVWNQYIQIGWNEGVDQANQIFTSNLNRLQRDYEGMVLYRKLLAQNMVTPPYVAQTELGITGGGNDMRINDRVLRITAIPQLQSNAKNWRPVIAEKKGKDPNALLLQYKTDNDKLTTKKSSNHS